MAMTGADIQTQVANIVRTYTKGVAAEDTRVLEHATQVQAEICGEIRTMDEDFLLKSATFNLVQDRSPNRYALPADFDQARYLERIIDETQGTYERVPHIEHIKDKTRWLDRTATWWIGANTLLPDGKPQAYLLGGDFIQIMPISDNSYPMRIWYEHQVPVVQVSENVFLNQALQPAIVWGTVVRELEYRELDSTVARQRFETNLRRGLENIFLRVDDGSDRVEYTDALDEYV